MLANILNTVAYGFLLLALLLAGLNIRENSKKSRWQYVFLFITTGLALLIITVWLT